MPNDDIGFFRTLASALKAGARSVVFMRSDVRAWAATPALFGTLVAMSLGLTIAWQMVYYGVPGRIDPSGLRGAFFELPLVFLAGWWAARVSFKGIGPLSLAVAFASLSVVLGAEMRQRFDAEGRSVELVNNAETVLKQPLDTQTNLRRTLPVPPGFERAVVSIREREKKMDFEHSNPQISIGSRIAEKPARIERRLEDAPRR